MAIDTLADIVEALFVALTVFIFLGIYVGYKLDEWSKK